MDQSLLAGTVMRVPPPANDPENREFLLDQYVEWKERAALDSSEASELVAALFRFALLHSQTTLVNALYRLTTEGPGANSLTTND